MCRWLERGRLWGWVLASVLFATVASGEIVFDASRDGLLSLSNDHYEFVFRKSNGSIASIVDRSTGREVSPGSRGGCLWGASRHPSTYVGGCSFQAGSGEDFTWQWFEDESRLRFRYVPSTTGVSVTVEVEVSDESWLDMSLSIESSRTDVLDYVIFPSDIIVRGSEIEEVLIPIMPGVVLQRRFFDQNRSFVRRYPGDGVFADFIAVRTAGGTISTYVASGKELAPSLLGVTHDDVVTDDLEYFTHAFAVKLGNGDRWESPRVRWRVGESFVDATKAYRTDSGVGAFPTIREKAGSRASALFKSPFFKIDMERMRRPFDEFRAVIDQLPSPSILHFVAFASRGFDEDYPDFLPPSSAHGSTEEFRNLFLYAQGKGHLVMPYVNPTWWDTESPTMMNLPEQLQESDVAVMLDDGTLLRESYAGKEGTVVSPHHPVVESRADELVRQMTEELPSDLLFEDQIGARPWFFDNNPAAPDQTSFIQGWIDHIRRHPNVLLGTEMGFDRLAETEIAFFGSMPAEDDERTDELFGSGNWKLFPFTQIAARDKVLFFVHNLTESSAVKSTFRLNVAFGQMMLYPLYNPTVSIFDPGPGGGLDTPGFRIVTSFQRRVLSRYGDELVEDFEWLAPEVTMTRFESMEVIANNDTDAGFAVDDHVVSPGGVYARSKDGVLRAGVFTSYNGVTLSPGDHWIIEERDARGVRVTKPADEDSLIVIAPLEGWDEQTPIEVRAYGTDARLIRTVNFTRVAQGLLFFYSRAVDQQLVDHYLIVDGSRPPRTRGVRR